MKANFFPPYKNNKLSLGRFKTSFLQHKVPVDQNRQKWCPTKLNEIKTRTKYLEKSKLQRDWGGGNPLRLDHDSHIGEAAGMKSHFSPYHLYV